MDNILIIHVPEGLNKPYQGSKGFYLRPGANSQKLKRDKILESSINENKIRFDEQICPDFNFKDFDDEKFEYYLKLAGITKILDKESFLRNLKVLNEKGMTNAGVLFFARSPYKYIFSSKIRCVHFRGNERIEILDKKEVDKGIIGNIEYAINYVKERVPVRFEIKGSRRIGHPEFPEDAYREVIVNAVIHRDYYESGEVAVEKLKSSILINNPGGLIPSFPREQFGNWNWPRNRLLADLLSKAIFMEKMGTGEIIYLAPFSYTRFRIPFSFNLPIFQATPCRLKPVNRANSEIDIAGFINTSSKIRLPVFMLVFVLVSSFSVLVCSLVADLIFSWLFQSVPCFSGR